MTTDWIEQIKAGNIDAMVPLVITWATALTHLDFTIRLFYLWVTEHPQRSDCITLLWVAQVVRKIGIRQSLTLPPLPLMRVHYVCLRHWNTDEGFELADAVPFFYITSARVFESH
jgi:hypothetical protein